MKGLYFLKTGFLAGLALLIAGQVYGADPDTLYVRHIEGTVDLAEAGSDQWMEAAVNTPLIGGDRVRTGPSGKAELFLKEGSVVRIGKGSIMKIIAVEPKGVQFRLDRGTVYIVATGSKEVPIFFDTPSAALDVRTPATLRVDAYDGGITEVSVYKGEAYAAQQKGAMAVRAGERLILVDSSVPRIAGLRSADEWLRWNTDRDRATLAAYAGSESYAYLPEELRTYSSDLDANGEWVYTPEYDYVWVPTVITVSSWSPYRFGRWVWILGNYVWVGYEPWGWAPYHYGRWVHHHHAGWCWVPPARGHVSWEPAHVAWVHSSRHIGWVPLAPGERYDRRTAPVIHQTNIYNTYNNITLERSVSTARTSYKNAAAADSVVTMERDSMIRAKAVNVNVSKRAAVPLKKVSLPAGVVPARAKSGPVRSVDGPKTGTGAAGQPRPATPPARGVTGVQAPQGQPKAQPVTTQKTAPTLRGGSGPAAASSLSARIESARTKSGQVAPRQTAPGTVRPVSSTPSGPRTESGNVKSRTPQAPASAPTQVQPRPAAMTAKPTQSTRDPAQSARTAVQIPVGGRSGSQDGGTVRAPEGRQPAASSNTPSVSAPAQVRPAAVSAGPARSVQTPAPQPATRVSEPRRQVAPRVEQKPVAAQNVKPQTPAARQNPAKEKVDAPAATAAPAPAGAAGGRNDNPKPASVNRGKGPQFQQSASMKASGN